MRRVRLAALAVLAVVALAAWSAVPAAGARDTVVPRGPIAPLNLTDFNDDGFDDLAIGAPYDDVGGFADAGVVHVLYGSATGLTTAGSQVWHQDRLNVAESAAAGDHFGWALAGGDFDADGFADLAVGVPHEDHGGDVDTGGVNVLYGSDDGLQAHRFQPFKVTQLGEDALAGSSLAALDVYTTIDDCMAGMDGGAELAIGAPGAAGGRGSVEILGGFLLVDEDQECGLEIDQDVGKTIGAAAGTTMVAADVTGDPAAELVIGAPLENVETSPGVFASDAGAVYIYRGRDMNFLAAWEQGEELTDAAQANDRLGESLAAADVNGDGRADMAIGVPREDLPAGVDVGAVHVVYDYDPTNEQFFHLDTPGVPGVGAAGDRFGSSLAFGNFEASDALPSLAVGVRGEDVAGLSHAGAVDVLYSDDGRIATTDNDRWTQDSTGVLDAAEANDHFGDAVYGGDFDGDDDADLAIGVPDESVGDIAGAGAVNVLYATTLNGEGLTATNDDLWHQDTPGIGETAQTGDRFGRSLP